MRVHMWPTVLVVPESRGAAYGWRWRAEVMAAVDRYLTLFRARGLLPEQVRSLAEASRAAVQGSAASPLADEIDGIAAGSGIQPWEAWALNARTEILAVARPSTGECSTSVLIPHADTPPRTIQTWDWTVGVGDEAVVQTFRTRDGSGVVTFGEAGQLAKIGVNTRGLGVHLNMLSHETDGAGGGVPVHVLARLILERATSVAEAIRLARSATMSASTVLTVVTTEPAAACLEISPVGVGAVYATPGTPLMHTNHFLDPGLAAGEAVAPESTTHERMACLSDHVELMGIADPVERALRWGAVPDAPISVRPDPGLPWERRSETKLTISLDVAHGALEYYPGAPADVTPEGWCRVSAA